MKRIVLWTMVFLLVSCSAVSVRSTLEAEGFSLLNEKGKILPPIGLMDQLILPDPSSYPTPGQLKEWILAQRGDEQILFAHFATERYALEYFEKLKQELPYLMGEEFRLQQNEVFDQLFSSNSPFLHLQLQGKYLILYSGVAEKLFLPPPLTPFGSTP